MPNHEEEILAANAAFCRAFATRDANAADTMDALWTRNAGEAPPRLLS